MKSGSRKVTAINMANITAPIIVPEKKTMSRKSEISTAGTGALSSRITSMTSETNTPSPTRIGAVTHPRLAASTNSSTMPSAVATPPAQASVRAANSCSISFAQSIGGRGGLYAAGIGRGAARTVGA